MIAVNVPQRAATAVAMVGGITPDVMGRDRIYLPEVIHLDAKDCYDRFVTTVDQRPHPVPMKGMNVDGLYKAQVLKDAVMAASLEPFLDRRILFCRGHFHSDYHLGIPYHFGRTTRNLNL